MALAAVLLLAVCGALPRPREMGDMALLRVMGVDRGESGPAMSAATGPQPPEQPAAETANKAADRRTANNFFISSDPFSQMAFYIIDKKRAVFKGGKGGKGNLPRQKAGIASGLLPRDTDMKEVF